MDHQSVSMPKHKQHTKSSEPKTSKPLQNRRLWGTFTLEQKKEGYWNSLLVSLQFEDVVEGHARKQDVALSALNMSKGYGGGTNTDERHYNSSSRRIPGSELTCFVSWWHSESCTQQNNRFRSLVLDTWAKGNATSWPGEARLLSNQKSSYLLAWTMRRLRFNSNVDIQGKIPKSWRITMG